VRGEALNGKNGVLECFDEHLGRWHVRVKSEKNLLGLKPVNLQKLSVAHFLQIFVLRVKVFFLTQKIEFLKVLDTEITTFPQ